MNLAHDLRVIMGTARKDLRTALAEPLFTVFGLLIPLNLLFLFALFVVSIGRAPIAVVMQDQGPLAQQLLSAMRNAHSFVIHQTSADQAQSDLRDGRVVAVVTVPASFDADLGAGRHVDLPVTLNNLNIDYTDDIRRAVPLSITSFYADAFPGAVNVRVQEIDVHPRDTDYLAYLGVSIVVAGMLLNGLLQGGIGAAREHESHTIKELLMSPASRWAIVAGKMLAPLLMSAVSAAAILLIVIVFFNAVPLHPLELLGYAALLMVGFVALGTLVGMLLRRRQAVIPLNFATVLLLFFLSGPFGPPNWAGPIQNAAGIISPLYYAIAAMQHAFHGFETSQFGLGADVAVLAGFTIAALVVSSLTLRRPRLAH
jgi:ABC-type multidrug transport system permease subunit